MRNSLRVRRGANWTDSPSRRLVEARKQNTLTRDPALHRLDFILRQFSVLAVISCIMDLVLDARVRGIEEARRALGLGAGSAVAGISWDAAMLLRQTTGAFLLYVLWRCIKHVDRSQARELAGLVPLVPRLYLAIIAADVVSLPLWALAVQSTRLTASTTQAMVVNLLGLAVLFGVMQDHIEKAQAALMPRLGGVAPAAASRSPSLRAVFLVCLGASTILMAAGYLASSH